MDYPSRFKGQLTEPIDGKSLLKVLQENKSLDRETLFWEHQGNKAVRAGDWKLVYSYGEQKWELYDLVSDRTETNDQAEKFPKE